MANVSVQIGVASGNASTSLVRALASVAAQSLSVTYAWPGQAANPVGYAAYGDGVLGTTAAGAISSGTSGSHVVYTKKKYSGVSTISANYVDFVQCDFDLGGGGLDLTGSNLTFTGCRFQSNNYTSWNVRTSASNYTFSYCSFTPLTSLYTSPPGGLWPSAGALLNTTTHVDNVNSVSGNSGYQYGILIELGSVTADHCDFWGFGNAITLTNTTAQLNFTNNWIHDAADDSPQSYHTDGIGYLDGGTGTSNVLIQGNVIASIANTNGIAFQAATGGYSNIQVDRNYLSGFGYLVSLGSVAGGVPVVSSTFTNNVFGTDIPYVWGPIKNDYTADFHAHSNLWKGNRLRAISGTTLPSFWTSADDGKFILPDSTASTTDFV